MWQVGIGPVDGILLRRLGADDLQHECRLLPPARQGAAVDQAGEYAAGVTAPRSTTSGHTSDRFIYLLSVIPDDTHDMRRMANDALRGVAHNWLDGKTPHETIVRVGKPAPEIVKLEEELDVDLVVMATHGRKGEKYDKLGSVTEQVVRDSTRPVLTIRPR